MTTPHEIDLHSEYLRADLFLAMGQPIEAAKVLEAVVTAEPDNEAALEQLARTLERQSRPADAAVHHRVADALGAA